MYKIFPTEKVKFLDEYTIQHEPIASIDLVERAANLFVHEFCRRYSKQQPVYIFAGPGNNGADALAIARILTSESYKVRVYLFNPTGRLSPDCEMNLKRLRELEIKCELKEIHIGDDVVLPELSGNDIVIDGLFGSGLNRPLGGAFTGIVRFINSSAATVVSVDMPSGLFGEDNRQNDTGNIINADLTLTFGFPKLAFLFPENEKYVGEWKVLDIALHPDALKQVASGYAMVEEEDVSETVRPRSRFAHKGTFGHALLIAGSAGKMGAALLAARACLRSGAGLITAHIPQRGEMVFQTAFPECMVSFDEHTEHFSSVPELERYSAVGIGPGLGQHDDSFKAFSELLSRINKPMVADADAINILAGNRDLLDKLPERSILTPHPKEFDRLAGVSVTAFERLSKAIAFAKEHKVCIVLKGAYTAVCTTSGNVYFNSTGNSGMATAGSGDVLTGIILSLLSQGYEPEEAAVVGVFIHGAAGDLAAAVHSQESMIAGDMTDMLGRVFKQIK